MKAIAVVPGKPDSVHLADLAKPSVDDVPGGRGVLVKVLRVGVDGTDKEINAAEYGAAPPGHAFLVIGHEGFGRVEAVGPNVSEVEPGDYVVATVRRPGSSLYDLIGTSDMTTDETYFERGINLRHGFLTEYYVDDAEFIVKVPQGLREVGVLLEPLTVVEKGIAQAYEIQRRLRVWRPRRAAVMGAGTIGILATLVLRLRGLAVTTFGLTRKPYLNSDLIEALGARYESTADLPILDGARKHGPLDLIFEATGYSPVVFDSMQHAERVFADPAIAKRLASFGATKGVEPLITFVHGPLMLLAHRPIRAVADFKGQKIRVPGGAPRQWKAAATARWEPLR